MPADISRQVQPSQRQILPPAKLTPANRALTVVERIQNVVAVILGTKGIMAQRGIHHWEIIDTPLGDEEFKKFTKNGIKAADRNAQDNWRAVMGDAPLIGAKLIKCGKDRKRHVTAVVLIAVLDDDVYVIGRVQAIRDASKAALDEIRPQLGLVLRRAGARMIVVLEEEIGHDDSLYLEGYRFARLPIELDEATLEVIDEVIDVFGFASTLGADPEQAPVFISRNARPARAPKDGLALESAKVGGEFEAGAKGLGRVKLHGSATFKKP